MGCLQYAILVVSAMGSLVVSAPCELSLSFRGIFIVSVGRLSDVGAGRDFLL